jgi:hypothetical protein
MAKRKSTNNIDPGSIQSHMYNEAAGAQKNMEVGRHLKPIQVDATTWSTDCSTARRLPSKGKNLAVYNNAGAIGAVTLGDAAGMTALAAGATDASGNVGIPCPAGQWTYIACNDKQFVRSTASTLLVFLIEDDTSVQ